jgi:hypothetical protein
MAVLIDADGAIYQWSVCSWYSCPVSVPIYCPLGGAVTMCRLVSVDCSDWDPLGCKSSSTGTWDGMPLNHQWL